MQRMIVRCLLPIWQAPATAIFWDWILEGMTPMSKGFQKHLGSPEPLYPHVRWRSPAKGEPTNAQRFDFLATSPG